MSLGQQLNRRVTIQRRDPGADEYGQPQEGWTDVATVWAGIRDLTGRQYVAAQAAQNSVTSEITIRYREGIEPAMRVVHGNEIFDIQAILGQDNRTLLLMAIKGLSNG